MPFGQQGRFFHSPPTSTHEVAMELGRTLASILSDRRTGERPSPSRPQGLIREGAHDGGMYEHEPTGNTHFADHQFEHNLWPLTSSEARIH